MRNLSNSLLLVRQFHHISQTELAKRMKISKSYLSELESGKKKVNIEHLNKYSDIFNIPTSSLLLFAENLEEKTSASKLQTFAAEKIKRILSWVADSSETNTCVKEQK